MSSPRSRSNRRQPLKVGPSQAPEPHCGPDQYAWRNYFASGCKPKAGDLRSEARQFHGARGLRELPFAGGMEGADGMGYGMGYGSGRRRSHTNGYNAYDYNGYGGYSGGRSGRRRSGSRRSTSRDYYY